MSMASQHDFKQFDIISDGTIDNHFHDVEPITAAAKATGGSITPTLQKKIMREWRILEKHLPHDTIFVRVHENHIRFLRAAIIGAAGTPYHDGLFFFDLAFPSDYPAHPPLVYFHSHGLRNLNPNLYACGNVCLSLLNTWSGDSAERWNPVQSTVLQVLVSLQALVLNKEPFFNEPLLGYSPTEKNSRVYNENAFLLTCKTTTFLLEKPPRYFEEFVVGHFCRRAGGVLGACRAYAEGRLRVGDYNCDGETTPVKKGDVSNKFREGAKAVHEDLVAAFKRSGVLVEGFEEVLVVKTPTFGVGNIGGIVKRLAHKMKRVLRLKKKKNNKNPLSIRVGGEL